MTDPFDHCEPAQRAEAVAIAEQPLLEVVFVTRVAMVLQMDLAAVERARHVAESRPDQEQHDVLQRPPALEVEVVDEIVLDLPEHGKRHGVDHDARPRRQQAADEKPCGDGRRRVGQPHEAHAECSLMPQHRKSLPHAAVCVADRPHDGLVSARSFSPTARRRGLRAEV